MKYYRMAVRNRKTGETDTYVSKRQGEAPAGWECTGVCGCFELQDYEKPDLSIQTRRFSGKSFA